MKIKHGKILTQEEREYLANEREKRKRNDGQSVRSFPGSTDVDDKQSDGTGMLFYILAATTPFARRCTALHPFWPE